MTVRERFQKLMAGDSEIDESPVIEWASWWDETIVEWEKDGMPKSMSDYELFDYFRLDKNTQFWIPHYRDDCPKPENQTSGSGMITGQEDYEKLKKYLLPEDAIERLKNKIQETIPLYKKGETIVWYTLEGYFWFPRVLFGPEAHLYAFYDEPDLYHSICEDLCNWHIRMIHEFGKYMKADFMTIAEDLSYNLGPMISEEMFKEFLAPYYRRIIPEIKKYGTKVFIDSDGKIDRAIPWFLDVGIDGVLPLERKAGVDINKLREEYPDLLMIGGFDKTCMFHGKDAIEQEIKRLLPTVRSGKYLLAMDHQTPPGTTMDSYRSYIQLLREYGRQACKDNQK